MKKNECTEILKNKLNVNKGNLYKINFNNCNCLTTNKTENRNFFEDDRDQIIEKQIRMNISRYSNNSNSNINTSNNENINQTSNYSFENFIKKSNSLNCLFNDNLNEKKLDVFSRKVVSRQNKNSYYDNDENISNTNTKNFSKNNEKSIIQLYLERRHLQEIQKVNFLRQEKTFREVSEIKDRPIISLKSKQIVENRMPNMMNVFSRLIDKNQYIKKDNELKLIEEIYIREKCPHKPKINKISKNFKRGINDLYDWNKKICEKKYKLEEMKNKTKEIQTKSFTIPSSEHILREINPGYLIMRVEDRLIDKGIKSKLKIENLKGEAMSSLNYNSKTKSSKNIQQYTSENSNKLITRKKKKMDHDKTSTNSKLIEKNPSDRYNKNLSRIVLPIHKRDISESRLLKAVNSNKKVIEINKSNTNKNLTGKLKIDSESIIKTREQLHNYLNIKQKENIKNANDESIKEAANISCAYNYTFGKKDKDKDKDSTHKPTFSINNK